MFVLWVHLCHHLACVLRLLRAVVTIRVVVCLAARHQPSGPPVHAAVAGTCPAFKASRVIARCPSHHSTCLRRRRNHLRVQVWPRATCSSDRSPAWSPTRTLTAAGGSASVITRSSTSADATSYLLAPASALRSPLSLALGVSLHAHAHAVVLLPTCSGTTPRVFWS